VDSARTARVVGSRRQALRRCKPYSAARSVRLSDLKRPMSRCRTSALWSPIDDDLHLALRCDLDVCGIEILVHDALVVRRFERLCDLARCRARRPDHAARSACRRRFIRNSSATLRPSLVSVALVDVPYATGTEMSGDLAVGQPPFDHRVERSPRILSEVRLGRFSTPGWRNWQTHRT
jgi:hypothetical protein